MEHLNKHGESKIKKVCTLPLTGRQVVDRLITDLAVFDFTPNGMVLVETQGNVTVEEVREKTEAPFSVVSELEAIY